MPQGLLSYEFPRDQRKIFDLGGSNQLSYEVPWGCREDYRATNSQGQRKIFDLGWIWTHDLWSRSPARELSYAGGHVVIWKLVVGIKVFNSRQWGYSTTEPKHDKHDTTLPEITSARDNLMYIILILSFSRFLSNASLIT